MRGIVVGITEDRDDFDLRLVLPKSLPYGVLHVWVSAGIHQVSYGTNYSHHWTVFLNGAGRAWVVGTGIDACARRLTGAGAASDVVRVGFRCTRSQEDETARFGG